MTTIPTIGFNVEQVTYKNLKFQVWDLGGQTSIRWNLLNHAMFMVLIMKRNLQSNYIQNHIMLSQTVLEMLLLKHRRNNIRC